jgi:ABC-2 type transport system ATP-binding protein
MVLQGRFYGLSKQDSARRAAELMERLDIADLDDRVIKTLSGGQRRRLDIALGLLHDPRLVFLDEPSTGLDPQSRANLWGHIRSLRDSHDTTVFLTTHYLDEADALCDRILVIDYGRIVAEGTPSELKAQVSGDGVEVGVAEQHVGTTAEIAGKLPDAHEISTVDSTVRFRVPRGDTAMPELLRALDAAGITMTSVQVHRPTLDDVFLTLTGRSLRDAEAESAPVAEEPADADAKKEPTDVA